MCPSRRNLADEHQVQPSPPELRSGDQQSRRRGQNSLKSMYVAKIIRGNCHMTGDVTRFYRFFSRIDRAL